MNNRHRNHVLPGAQRCRSCRTPIVWAHTSAHTAIPVEPAARALTALEDAATAAIKAVSHD